MERPTLETIKKIAGGDFVFEHKLIAIIKWELPLELVEYHEHVAGNAFAKAALIVHKLKHKISILHMHKSYKLAERYEEELREGKATLQEDFEDVINGMSSFVNQL
jgi:hypothetical protein